MIVGFHDRKRLERAHLEHDERETHRGETQHRDPQVAIRHDVRAEELDIRTLGRAVLVSRRGQLERTSTCAPPQLKKCGSAASPLRPEKNEFVMDGTFSRP